MILSEEIFCPEAHELVGVVHEVGTIVVAVFAQGSEVFVSLQDVVDGDAEASPYTPGEARKLAALLLKAADKADSDSKRMAP